jgi:uncharacterized protein YdeI (YjbR/CyaY-like superfamily)
MNKQVTYVIEHHQQWSKEFAALREIIHSFELEETIKWRWPCYTLENKNIVLMNGFKDYCALLLFKGALLKDEHQALSMIGESTQAERKFVFRSLEEVKANETLIKDFIQQSIDLEKAGAKFEYKKTEDYSMLEELEEKFRQDPSYKEAFYALTPGRQRGYLYHFGSAKQSATRSARIEKMRDKIFDGKGFDER